MTSQSASPSGPPVQIEDQPAISILVKRFGTFESWSKKIPAWLVGSGRSNLTPFDTYDGNEYVLSAEEFTQRKVSEKFQRKVFEGFSTREIRELNAFGTLPLPTERSYIESNLDNPIHPLFERERWVKSSQYPAHMPPIPLGRGREGFYEAANDIVWKILEPVLRLASQCISDDYMWSWWDALTSSNFQKIDDPSMVAANGKYFASFHLREGQITASDRENMRSEFLKLAEQIGFGFIISETDPHTGAQLENHFGFNGVTMPSDGGQRPIHWAFGKPIQVRLATFYIDRLLADDLTPGEKIVNQFMMATTILHETSHALYFSIKATNDEAKYIQNEPFFEDECISELGYCAENLIFNGEHSTNNNTPYMEGAPAATIFRIAWPSEKHGEQSLGLKVRTAGASPLKKVSVWPCPITYLERLMQMDFWTNQVAVYGPQVINTGPSIFGRKFDKDRRDYAPSDQWTENLAEAISSTLTDVQGDIERRKEALDAYVALRNTIVQEAGLELSMEMLPHIPTVSPDAMPTFFEPGPEFGDRNTEIWNLIKGKQRVLAMHTLDFRISEVGFLAYVNSVNDKAPFTPEQFRRFIIHYGKHGDRKQHFRWGISPYTNVGWVERRKEGWEVPVPDNVVFQPVIQDVGSTELWLMFCYRLYTIRSAFYSDISPHFRDYGKTVVLTGINQMKDKGLTEQQFEDMVRHALEHDVFFVCGPPGVLRFSSDAFTRGVVMDALEGVPRDLWQGPLQILFIWPMEKVIPELVCSLAIVQSIVRGMLAWPKEEINSMFQDGERFAQYLLNEDNQRDILLGALQPQVLQHIPDRHQGELRDYLAGVTTEEFLNSKEKVEIVNLLIDNEALRNAVLEQFPPPDEEASQELLDALLVENALSSEGEVQGVVEEEVEEVEDGEEDDEIVWEEDVEG